MRGSLSSKDPDADSFFSNGKSKLSENGVDDSSCVDINEENFVDDYVTNIFHFNNKNLIIGQL